MNRKKVRLARMKEIFAGAFAVACVATFTVTLAPAHDIDTEHLFGFTSGSDLGGPGEKELESETEGRFGKRAGTYAALTSMVELKYTPGEGFRIAGAASVAGHRIAGVPGLDDRKQWAFDSLAVDLRYRLLDRDKAGFGLTVSAEPHWARRDETSGEPVDAYGIDLLIMLDRELIKDKVFAAFNLSYVPEVSRSRVTDMVERSSTLAFAAAVAGQVSRPACSSAPRRDTSVNTTGLA